MSHNSTPASRRPLALPVVEPSAVSSARQLAVALAREVGFDRPEAEKIAIAVSEAGSNMVKHARGGEMVFRVLRSAQIAGIEMLKKITDAQGGFAAVKSFTDSFDTFGDNNQFVAAAKQLGLHRVTLKRKVNQYREEEENPKNQR